MKKILTCLALVLGTMAFTQTGIGTVNPNPSAVLDLTSTNKGLLLPRVANTAAIANPVDGLFIYDLSCSCFRTYANGLWSGSLNASAGNITSNGSAIVSAFACNIASAGTITLETPVSGVTQTITATVTKAGTYSISATANGVTFSGSGTFTGTGAQNIVLTATGTPISPVGSPYIYSFTLNTTPSCTFNRNIDPLTVTSITTGKIWMDRNLGATQVATSSTDAASYGFIYQWGRFTDGHQIRTSTITNTLSNTDTPGNPNFISNSTNPFDWRSGQNVNLWQGVSGINNPCPNGFRIPTEVELNAERVGFSPLNATGAFNSVLKLPLAGNRGSTGTTENVGTRGIYWSSTISTQFTNTLNVTTSAANMQVRARGNGFSVRCIKN